MLPSAPNPLINVTNIADHHGDISKANVRMPIGDKFSELTKIKRQWIFTPRSSATSENDSYLATFKKVAGDAGSSQYYWAWYLDSESRNLLLRDNTLPALAGQGLKITYKIKKKESGSATFKIDAQGDGTSTLVEKTISDTDWHTFKWLGSVPSAWQNSTDERKLKISVTNDFYVAGVVVEEVTSSTASLGFNKISAGFSNLNAAVNTAVNAFTLNKLNGVALIKFYGVNISANSGYTHTYKEYSLSVSTASQVSRVNLTENINNPFSINSNTRSIDFTLSTTVADETVVVQVTPTSAGSSPPTNVSYFIDVEVMSNSSLTEVY